MSSLEELHYFNTFVNLQYTASSTRCRCWATHPFSSSLSPLPIPKNKCLCRVDPARRPRFNASITLPRRIFHVLPGAKARNLPQVFSCSLLSSGGVAFAWRTNAGAEQPLEETIERADGPDRYICFVFIGAYHDEQQVSFIIQNRHIT